MTRRKKRTIAGDKTICLPMSAETNYEKLVQDTAGYRVYLDQMIALHPELFPEGIELGYSFHGFVESGKLHLTTRRIRLKSTGAAYQLRPDTVMPYMIGTTEEVEKGLYLRRRPLRGHCSCSRSFGDVLVSSDPSFRTNLNGRQHGENTGRFPP
jgi:hypothetical protein